MKQAVNYYVKHKVWKLNNPSRQKLTNSIENYLSTKVDDFVHAYPEEQQESVKDCFHRAIIREAQNVTVQLPLRRFSVEEWEARIRKQLKTCFPNLLNRNTENRFEEIWTNKTNKQKEMSLRLMWGVSLNKSGSPKIMIESVKVSPSSCGKRGIATRLLRAMVEELQKEPDPYAKISLHAWSGGSSYYGSAKGALIWSRLGFEFRGGKCMLSGSSLEKMTRNNMRNDFKKWITSSEFKYFFYMDLYSMGLLNSLGLNGEPSQEIMNSLVKIINSKEFVKETFEQLEKCFNPWDFAGLTIRGIHIGKVFMSGNRKASYHAVFYPNFSDSFGRIQYNKRMEELKRRFSSTGSIAPIPYNSTLTKTPRSLSKVT